MADGDAIEIRPGASRPRGMPEQWARHMFSAAVFDSVSRVYACLWWHRNEKTGRCDPSVETIKELTGISESTIQRAFRKLARAGLIDVEYRAGRANQFNLTPVKNDTPRKDDAPSKSDGTPVKSQGGPQSNLNRTPVTRVTPKHLNILNKKQNMHARARDAVLMGGVVGEGNAPRRPLRCPHVSIDDLRSMDRLHEVFEEVVERGLLEHREVDLIFFFAAAMRAMRIGEDNKAGLFATIINRGQRDCISIDDEDAARLRLREYFHGVPIPKKPNWRDEYSHDEAALA